MVIGLIERRQDELVIAEGEKFILLSMEKEKYLGWHIDEDGEIVDEIDENQIEICYREDDENGWGVGGGEYFSTADIKAMADCIRSVIYKKQAKASYSCQQDVFRICLEYDSTEDIYSFTAALIETLNWEYHISITKTGLTRSALDEYIQPFFEWEREFPIKENQEGKHGIT